MLINNAGIMPPSLLAAGKHDEWDRMIDVIFRGVLCCDGPALNDWTRKTLGWQPERRGIVAEIEKPDHQG